MVNKYTSRTLKAIAYLWVAFPVLYLIYARLGLAILPSGLVKMVLSPGFWFVSAISVISGLGLLRIKWYGWYLYLASNALVSYQTALVLAHFSESPTKITAFILTTAFQIALIVIVGREVRVPYFFPRIRWWESDPRYKLSLPTRITREDGSEIEGLIMDLSLGGCFVKTHGNFNSDENVKIDFVLFERALACQGRVVWTSESTVTHPKGVGVKFQPLSRETTFVLRMGIRKVRRLARAYTQITRERNWREYLQRERRYQGKNK